MIGIPEQKAVDALGVSLFELRAASRRLLTLGVHFEHDQKKRPMLWPLAFDVLGKSLEMSDALIAEKKAAAGWTVELSALAEKQALAGAGEAEPDVIDLFVGQICPNPIWVKCRLPSNAIVQVQVPNNRALQPGKMLANCRRVRAGVYAWQAARRVRIPAV